MSTYLTPETSSRLRHLPPEERSRIIDRTAEAEASRLLRRVRAAKLEGARVSALALAMERRNRGGRRRTCTPQGARPTADELATARAALESIAEAHPELASCVDLT